MTFSEQAEQELKTLEEKKKKLQAELAEIEKETRALHAYLKAKGTTPRRTGVRQSVLDSITSEGITRSDILQKLEASDDKATRSVDNALSALTKSGKIQKEGTTYKTA